MCLETLEILTNQLVARGLTDYMSTLKGRIDFNLQKGEAFALNLFTEDDVHISRMFMKQESISPYHLHDDADEYFIIVSGELTYLDEYRKLDLKTRDFVVVSKDTAHLLISKTDVGMIVVTIPATKEAKQVWGNGEQR